MKDITRFTSTLLGSGTRRYKPGAQAFHWITAALMGIVIPLGWIFAEFKTKGTPPVFDAPLPGTPGDYASVHKTIGLLIFAIVAARIVYRIASPPPALPRGMALWETGLSHASHWLLYAILIVMPVSGYVMSSASDRPISILGLFDFPKLPISKDIGHNANAVHLYVQWAVYALIALHIAATAYHLVVRRDGLLDRMLPRQRTSD